MKKVIIFTIGSLFLLVFLFILAVFVFPWVKNLSTKKTNQVQFSDLASIENIQTIHLDEKIAENDNSAAQVAQLIKNAKEDSELVQDKKEGLQFESKQISSENTLSAKKNQNAQADFSITQKLVSFGFQNSNSRKIKAIIIHTTYNNLSGDPFDFDKVTQEWKDAGVSPHYAITREGKIYQLVADQNIAWHAGVSTLPDGTTDVNGSSIGIEIVNDKSSKFSDAQYSALNNLIGNLKNKYPIKYILGHDEIAPDRKTDPWGVEWNRVSH